MLAHILVKTEDEFKGMNPKEVVSYIEGQPYISTVPVEPGLTNTSSKKDGLSQIIINVEAQKERDFENSGYDAIKRVF